MKNTLMLSAAALFVASAAFAAPDGKNKKAARETVNCAVMTTSPVNVKEAHAKKMFADHKGNRYYFCCAGCPAAFKKDPAKYAKNDHVPTPGAKAAPAKKPAKKG
jgi:YHS domain-containing protein